MSANPHGVKLYSNPRENPQKRVLKPENGEKKAAGEKKERKSERRIRSPPILLCFSPVLSVQIFRAVMPERS